MKLEILEELQCRLAELGADGEIKDDALEVDTQYGCLVIDYDDDGWHFHHSSDLLYFSPEDPTVWPRLCGVLGVRPIGSSGSDRFGSSGSDRFRIFSTGSSGSDRFAVLGVRAI